MGEDQKGTGDLIENLAEASEKIIESFESVGKIEVIIRLPEEELKKIKSYFGQIYQVGDKYEFDFGDTSYIFVLDN
jgi:hypothetical protein